jgi:hypothetical protein
VSVSILTPVVAALVALPLALGFWMLVTGLLAVLSGWSALAAAFPGGARPLGEPIRGQVLGTGRVQEKNVTTAIPTAAGLYLYPMVLFRYRRPPVLVPWTKVRYLDSHQLLWARWHEVDLGGVTTLKVRPGLLPILRSHGVVIPADALA